MARGNGRMEYLLDFTNPSTSFVKSRKRRMEGWKEISHLRMQTPTHAPEGLAQTSLRNERYFIFRFLFLCLIFGITCYLAGCSKDRITTPPDESLIPKEKDVLLQYHPEEYLTMDIKSAPLLTSDNHLHGWQRADCTKCHRSPSKEAPEVCTNCHGKNGINNQENTCSNCHKVVSMFGNPPSGQHQTHVAKGPKDTNCEKCHPGRPEKSNVHASGIQNIVFDRGGTYKLAPNKEILGTCKNIACHEDRQWGGEGCSSCHDSPPNTGYHAKHLAQENLSCQTCHEENQHDSDIDSGSIETGGIKYNLITGDCASDCHKTQKWRCTDCHDYPPENGNHSKTIHEFGCDECHSDHDHSSKAAIRPKDFSNVAVELKQGGEYRDNTNDGTANGLCSGAACHEPHIWGGNCAECHSQPPETGVHVLHVKRENNNCQDCHQENKHEPDRGSGTIDIGGVEYKFINGDCASSCHQQRQWDCATCHEYPPQSGNHRKHQYSCDECHHNHTHSSEVAIAPRNFSNVKVELKQSGEYASNGLCRNIACHEPRIWGGNCAECHSQPPETGVHVLHVKRENNNCQDCHQGNKHEPDKGSGTIDIGGVAYNVMNGNCTSSCHQQRQWNCATCHGYPPKSNNHPAHQSYQLGCEQCHNEHWHSSNAVLAPQNLFPIQVDFAQGGGFNSNSQLCSSVVCHESRVWGSNCTDCHNSPPNTGAHQIHLAVYQISCQECHKGNQHDVDNNSGFIEIGGVGYNPINGECTSVCHPPKRWPACTNCHRYPPDSGNHFAHNEPTGKYFSLPRQPILCGECHADHQHSYKTAIAPNDFSEVKVRLQDGAFDPSNKLCSVSCHDSQKWDTSCSDCHGAPPDTGRHSIHLRLNLNCNNCHKNNQHDLDISSGTIEIGNIIYDQFNGYCTSACHKKKQWNCIACHGYPPDTGQHTVHTNLSQFECRICHENHEHTFRAATNPNDQRNVRVSFTILGDWDKLTNSCKNIGCHFVLISIWK